MGYYLGGTTYDITSGNDSEDETDRISRSRKSRKSRRYLVNFENDFYIPTEIPLNLKKGQRISKKMANSLDSTTLVNIAKNRSRLLKLADGIRTRKKPGSSKKSLRLDPAYTNIEHLVFGTYRARSATPDSSGGKRVDHQDGTPTRNNNTSGSHFPRRVPYRSSDGSESERSSTVSSTDAKCECNRHSPSLVIHEAGETRVIRVPDANGTSQGGRRLSTPESTAGEKPAKGDDVENELDFHVDSSSVGGYSSLSAPQAERGRETSFDVKEPEVWIMPSTVDLRRGPISPALRNPGAPKSKELRVQNRSKIRKALSAEDSDRQTGLSASSSGGGGEDSGYQTSNGSSRRTSWKELATSGISSSHSDSKLQTRTRCDSSNSCAIGVTRDVPWSEDTVKFERQNSCPSGIPKPNHVRSSLLGQDNVDVIAKEEEDTTVGTQAKNAALRKAGSLQDRKLRYPVSGRSQIRKETDCAVPDPNLSDEKLAVTCKIRITPPQNCRNMKGNTSKQISSTGNYKNLISGSAIQAGGKPNSVTSAKTQEIKAGQTTRSTLSGSKTSLNGAKSVSSLNGSKSNLNGSKSSLNGSKRDCSAKGKSGVKGGSPKFIGVSKNKVTINEDADKCSERPEMNRSVKSARPQTKDGHQSPLLAESNKFKLYGLQSTVQKGERQRRPRQQVPLKEPPPPPTPKNNMARWADIRGRNMEKSIPDCLTKFVPAEDTHVPAPEPFSLPECAVLTDNQPTKRTTWAQLGKSRSIDAKNSKEDAPIEKRRSSASSLGSYYSLDATGSHQNDCSVETVVEPIARRSSKDATYPLDQVETETKVVNGVTGIPVPRKMSDSKAIRVMVPMPLPSYRLTKDGPSSLPVACDEEPSFEIMNETILGTNTNVKLDLTVKDKPPIPPPSSPKTGPTLIQTPPVICRKRSLSVGSPARHLDLRLLAAFQRYGDATIELPENPENWMSDIEEKDENSSSSASRATSEEPPEVFMDTEWTVIGNHRVSVINGTVYRSPVRRRTTGSLGLERLLPIGPPISTPTSSWKGTPSSSPGRESISSRDNISVIPCNFNDDSSAKSTPARRINYQSHPGPNTEMEHSQNQGWEKSVTIETGPTNSHMIVGVNGEETFPLVQNGDVMTETPLSIGQVPPITPYPSLPPSSYRLMRNRPISRSERHLKTTSTPEFRAGSVEAINGGGSVRDVRRPWSQVYEELDAPTILSQTNPNCFSVPNFPRFGDGCASPTPADSGGSFFNRFSSIRATDSMLQKFRKTFSLRFQKARKEALSTSPQTVTSVTNLSQSPPITETDSSSPPLPVTDPPDQNASFSSITVSDASFTNGVYTEPSSRPDPEPSSRPGSEVESELGSLWNVNNADVLDPVKDDGLFKLGLSVLRSSRDRKHLRKKDCRSSKCNSADSGIQVEGTCPGDGTTEPNSATESPAVLRRRAVSASESSPKNKITDRPLSDYIDHIDLESVDEVTSLGGGKSVGDVFRESSSPRSRDNLYCSPVRRTPSVERQMSTPPPIKIRTERKIRPRIKRQKGKSRLRRSISQPLDLEKMGFSHKGLEHGLSDHEGSRESTASSDEDFSSDNELYHILKSPNRKQNILKEMYEDTVTYAEALWDHVTIDLEELPFKAGEVIEVTDTGDKDWWWGSIGARSGWFPAPFVRLRVSQEDTVEDCIIKMADGTLTTRNHAPRKMSISLLSNEQVRANVVREIVTTERDFVQHLRDVVEGYLKQVRRRPDMFSDEVVSTIFGNIEAIYTFQNVFLKHLEACINWQSPHISEIGQCFLNNKESFKIYSEYCNNHPLAVSQLQELYSDQKYVQFFEACRLLQDMIDISLDGFLLTPVQKICKYPLQLAELLKYTKPDHPDHRTVTDALAAMRGVAQMVNERKRRMECLEKLVEWQKSIEGWEGPDVLETSSVLIHSGEVTRVTSNWSRDITLFLFDHLLVYCKKDLLKRNTAVYKGRIDLNHCCVFDVEDGKDAQFGISLRNAWKIHCSKRDKWFLFYAKSPLEKSRWLQALREERQLGLEDREQGFIVTNQAKKAAKLAVLNKSKTKRPRAKIPKGSRPHPDTAVVELLLDPPGPKTRSGSLPSNLSPSMVVNGTHSRATPTKKKGSGWFHFGSGKKTKK